jgi:hypothetical protein
MVCIFLPSIFLPSDFPLRFSRPAIRLASIFGQKPSPRFVTSCREKLGEPGLVAHAAQIVVGH